MHGKVSSVHVIDKMPCSDHLPIAAAFDIYTTIDGVVCPPNISETVAGRLMKLAHRQGIASTTIKLIFKKTLLSILSILVKTIQRIFADPKRKLSPPFANNNLALREQLLPEPCSA